jgi:hypothetical protein
MVFDGLYHQNIADYLKGFVLRRNPPSERRRGLDAIQRFERAEWNPTVFEEALKAAAPGRFYRDEDGDIRFDPGEGGRGGAFEAVVRVIEHYLQYMEQGHF